MGVIACCGKPFIFVTNQRRDVAASGLALVGSADNIWLVDASLNDMVGRSRPSEQTLRLVAQLQSLSELIESLAFRVVELEERLAATEASLSPATERSALAAGELAAEQRLQESEGRIARLEAWLSGADVQGAQPRQC